MQENQIQLMLWDILGMIRTHLKQNTELLHAMLHLSCQLIQKLSIINGQSAAMPIMYFNLTVWIVCPLWC